MKVIVAGGTGFIGGATLKRLAELPQVTSVVVLSRRELPTKLEKVQTIIIKDFKQYDDDVLQQLTGAEACVWALGSPTSGIDVHDGFTTAAVEAFKRSLIPALKESGKEFRFVYTSGSAVVRDQSKFLLFLSSIRKSRGVTENTLVNVESEQSPAWKTFIVRPALVLKPGSPLKYVTGAHGIQVNHLGAAMANLAVNGGDKQTFENTDLQQIGLAALGDASVKA